MPRSLLDDTRYNRYVRLRPNKANVLLNSLPPVAIDISKAPPAEMSHLFPMPVKQVNLEIGFGYGEHLIAEALRTPRIGFVCCETYLSGVVKVLKDIENENVKNIRMFVGDAADLLNWITDDSLARVDLLFPDPWRKRRHHRRRFIREDMLRCLSRTMRNGAEFRFASDSLEYATWAVNCFQKSSDFKWSATNLEECRSPWPNFPGTRYEEKALSEGRQPYYLTFYRIRSE